MQQILVVQKAGYDEVSTSDQQSLMLARVKALPLLFVGSATQRHRAPRLCVADLYWPIADDQ